jgi:hypothetical protein
VADQKWCLSCDEPTAPDAYRCANCGNGQFAQVSKSAFLNLTPGESEAAGFACSECNSDLIEGQKYCSKCGIEIDWPLRNGPINLTNHVSPTGSNSSWLMVYFKAMGAIGKTISVIFIIYNVFAVISLFAGNSSPDDLSKCNATYDANFLKTYGVFRCPAIYNQTGSSFDSGGLITLIFFDALVLGILYFYAKRKLKR